MIHERDRQTDRRTDGRTDTACRHRPRLCIAIAQQRYLAIFANCCHSHSQINALKIRDFRTSTYDEYFGRKIFAIGWKVYEEIGLARDTQLSRRCYSFKFIQCMYCRWCLTPPQTDRTYRIDACSIPVTSGMNFVVCTLTKWVSQKPLKPGTNWRKSRPSWRQCRPRETVIFNLLPICRRFRQQSILSPLCIPGILPGSTKQEVVVCDSECITAAGWQINAGACWEMLISTRLRSHSNGAAMWHRWVDNSPAVDLNHRAVPCASSALCSELPHCTTADTALLPRRTRRSM